MNSGQIRDEWSVLQHIDLSFLYPFRTITGELHIKMIYHLGEASASGEIRTMSPNFLCSSSMANGSVPQEYYAGEGMPDIAWLVDPPE